MSLAAEIAAYLGLTERYISSIAANADHSYFRFSIPKRDGTPRTIHHPSRRLKGVQRGLNRLTIARWQVHNAAMAYRPSTSILDNAKRHADSNYLLRVDLKDFFASITASDIDAYLQQVEPSWTSSDRTLFARLVCLNGRLTIGSPSSPGISNAICYELDRRLTDLAASQDVQQYTRYADDLFFSCMEPDVLSGMPDLIAEVLDSLDIPCNLQLNAEKTRHSSRAGRRRVTGLVLGSDKQVGVGRPMKRRIRSSIYRLDALNLTQRRQLAGTLNFVRHIEPDFINQLFVKYGAPTLLRALRGYD